MMVSEDRWRPTCRRFIPILVASFILMVLNTVVRADTPATAPTTAPVAAATATEPVPDPTGTYQLTPPSASTPGYTPVTDKSSPKEMAAAINAAASAQARNSFSIH